jgi:predicted DNA-binding protein
MVRRVGNRVVSSVYLDQPAHDALNELADRTRVAVAAYLREAVDDLLAKYKVKVPKARRKKGAKR